MLERVEEIPLDRSTRVRGVAVLDRMNGLNGLILAGPQTFTISSSLEARLLSEKRQNAAEQGKELPTSTLPFDPPAGGLITKRSRQASGAITS